MPFVPPANITESGNGTNLYALASEINQFPDPLIIDNLVVMNQGTIQNLTVSSESISLSSTLGQNVISTNNDVLTYRGEPLISGSILSSNYISSDIFPATEQDGRFNFNQSINKFYLADRTFDPSGNSYPSQGFFNYLSSMIQANEFPSIVFSNPTISFIITLTSFTRFSYYAEFSYTGTAPVIANDTIYTLCLPSYNVEIPPASDVANWSNYPSINNNIVPNPALTVSDFNIGSDTNGLNMVLKSNQDIRLDANRAIELNSNIDGITGTSFLRILDVGHLQVCDVGESILETALIEIVARNGTGGDIEILSEPSNSLGPTNNGGLINIKATSATGSSPLALSRVNVEAATVSIEAGALGSLAYVPASVNLLCGVGSGIQILTGTGVINSAAGATNTVSGGAGVYLNGASSGVNVAGGNLFITNGNALKSDDIGTFTTGGSLGITTTGTGPINLNSGGNVHITGSKSLNTDKITTDTPNGDLNLNTTIGGNINIKTGVSPLDYGSITLQSSSNSSGGYGINLYSTGYGVNIVDGFGGFLNCNKLNANGSFGTVGQVLTSNGLNMAWDDIYTGVLAVFSGNNISVDNTNPQEPIINLNTDISVNSIKPTKIIDKTNSYGLSGQIPVANDGVNQDWEWKTPAASTNVQGKFGSLTAGLALTGTYQNMATQTFTTLNAAAPLLVWGTLNVFNTGLVDAVISVRLLINGTGGLVQTKTVIGQHYESITCLGGGTGPTPAGVFNVSIQALITTGAATRVNASVITNAQFILSV